MAKTLDIKITKLTSTSTIPTKAHDTDAGWDLYCSKKVQIYANSIKAIETGIAVSIPKGWVGIIKERSGFSLNNTLSLKAGVVDSGYIGEIKIIMANNGDYPIIIEPSTKIAQMLFLPVPEVSFIEVNSLEETARGENGFGSTDKK